MFNLKHKIRNYWGFGFFSFLKKNEEKAHNMLYLMLDFKFKTIHLVSTLICCEQGKAIIEEYDKNLCFLCFKCH
jgi:hypothetical protein